MSNAIDGSPVTLVADPMWKRIPSPPPGPLSSIGAKGCMFTAADGSTHYALAETGQGDFAFCWFVGRARRDAAVRCTDRFQVPTLDGEGRALVIGAGGELLVVRPDGVAESLGRGPDGFRPSRAAWTASGFAVADDELALHLYRWSPGAAPVGVGRYTGVACVDLRRAGGRGDLLLACDTDRLDGLEAAWDERARFPTVTRAGDAAPLTAGGATATSPAASATVPALHAPLPARRATGVHVRALMDLLAARKLAERTPADDLVELLAWPMDADLHAYVHHRATHEEPGVIAIHEAWLDARPRRVTDAYALGEGTDAIELGSLACGDRVVAVFGVPGARYHLAELSHEDRDARPFRDLEHWLADVCRRTDGGTDLDPYLPR